MYSLNTLKSVQEVLKQKTGKAYFNSNSTELMTFCPNCERDRFFKNLKCHLYISTKSPIFNCFKCDFSGILPKLLNKLNIDTDKYIKQEDLDIGINNKLKDIELDYSNFKDLKIPTINNNQFIEKQNYLKERFINEVDINKIDNLIFDIKKFIEINNIETDETTRKIIDLLQKQFVGFLSTRKSIIICRNIDKESDFRYYNLYLGKKSYFKDFYGIINNSGKRFDNINNIVLSEGVFDIIQSYNNPKFAKLREKSCLWAASLNCKYNVLIRSVLDYCKISKANIIILSDSGIEPYKYKILEEHPSIENLVIYWNKTGKDFGELNIEPVRKIFSKPQHKRFIKNAEKV